AVAKTIQFDAARAVTGLYPTNEDNAVQTNLPANETAIIQVLWDGKHSIGLNALYLAQDAYSSASNAGESLGTVLRSIVEAKTQTFRRRIALLGFSMGGHVLGTALNSLKKTIPNQNPHPYFHDIGVFLASPAIQSDAFDCANENEDPRIQECSAVKLFDQGF